MDNFTLVRPEHLNHHGYLFGGALLKWVDELAWLAASRDFADCTLVTIGMEKIQFRQRVENGSILRFSILPLAQGSSAVTYSVEVFADAPGGKEETQVFSNRITFVRLNEQGQKCPLPKLERLRSQGEG